MCKKILLLMIALLACMHKANGLEVTFADANLTNCVRELITKNQWQHIEQITSIECHSKKIAALDGITQLVKLQKLSLYNNLLTRAELTGLSELRHLNLAKNRITAAQLGNLPSLAELYLFNNQLAQLHLQPLPALKLLKINENRIVKFTYAELPAVEKMYMFNNLMEHVDIYRLPRMTYMDARQNPMPDPLDEEMDKMKGVTYLHDGNAEDWQ